MFLKRLQVSNFRSLKSVEINFEHNITVIVGENDAGKSSIMKILEMAIVNDKDKIPSPSDFHYGENTMEWVLDFGDQKYIYEFRLDNEKVEKKIKKEVSWGNLDKYLVDNHLIDELDENDIKIIFNDFGHKTNKRTIDSLRDEFIDFLNKNKEKIQDNIVEEIELAPQIDLKTALNIDVHYLDGKKFEDVSSFVKDFYLKDELKNIWNHTIRDDDNRSIGSVVRDTLQSIMDNKQDEINDDVLPKIKEFIPELNEIQIELDPVFKDLNINVVANFVDHTGTPIRFDNKGDGTKRRITFALLKHKVEKSGNDIHRIYLFDEPDTHLHVRAQKDLMDILANISEKQQVIVATHSPFILNCVNPDQVRLFRLKKGATNIISIEKDKINVNEILRALGIENTNLFFTRKILIVEGESEEIAIPIIYRRLFNKSLQNELITIINSKGVNNVPQLAKLITEIMPDTRVFVLVDNDYNCNRKASKKILDELIESNHNVTAITVGYKEFEDAFSDDVIYHAVKSAFQDLPKKWSIEAIKQERGRLMENPNFKFSGAIAKLADKQKTDIAKALAEYCPDDKIPNDLFDLFEKLRASY